MFTNDTGVIIELTINKSDGTAYDLSPASTKEIAFESPSGIRTTKAASFVTDGSDGKIKYVTQANDISEAGMWKVRAHLVLPTFSRKSSAVSFVVYD